MLRLSLVLSLFVALAASAFADTPVGPMNYQGRLLDNAGIPVTGSYNFVVRVYDALSGGTLKYQENHNAVAVDDGVYNFLVGTQTKSGGDSTWSVELWNCCANLFLEVVVNGEPLSPRHRLAAAPYAFQANLALTTNNALALGGKTAAEYDNILGAICESSKGKWLELVQKCLGAGSSFPGSATTALSTLTASTDLTNLDLSRADISGINFGVANLSGTSLDKATLNVNGIKNADLSNTVLTEITSTGSATLTANLTGARIGGFSLANWSMGGVTLTGASIADLTGCPSALPVNYFCVEHKITPNGKKLVVGPNMNFSETSLLKNRITNVELDNYEIGSSKNLSGSTFYGNRIEGPYPIFQNTNFSGSNFKNTEIRRETFSGNLDLALFNNSTISNTAFYATMANVDFTAAELSNVVFSPSNNASLNFAHANLVNPIFMDGPTGLSLFFETSTLTNPVFASGITSLDIVESSKIFGGLYLGSQVTYAYFMETYFAGGNLSGNFTGAQFSFGEFFNVSFNGANFTGALNLGSADFVGVNWFGATCPDGYQVTTQGGTCVGHFDP